MINSCHSENGWNGILRYFIIANPISGHGLGEKSIPRIEEFFRSNHLDYKLVRTERIMHATEQYFETGPT